MLRPFGFIAQIFDSPSDLPRMRAVLPSQMLLPSRLVPAQPETLTLGEIEAGSRKTRCPLRSHEAAICVIT